MTKKPVKSKWQEPQGINSDFGKMHLYKRNHKLIAPIPYVWKLDMKKIVEFKNNK